ncbi:Zinc finger protein ZAT5 [Forsythia ovata]|uniref:Zinc finger protein ZAT5 n=1 Tax=Forsythia ovata TaxID=205694 RepID=A0ABD1WXE9_9LAMI
MDAKDHHHIIKGKRTKRPRTSSPLALTMATTSSCSTAASDGGFGAASDISGNFDPFAASPLNSDEHTDEEEDMANCLILLAKGQTRKSSENPASNKTAATVALEVYQCKTCNRSFPSFQALGGHRASHKKPKTTTLEENPKNIQLNYDHNTILSLQMSSRNSGNNPQNKSRVHECSICGAEFNSGQALGGHMRRHRPMPLVPAVTAPDHSSHEESKEAKKTRNLLSLDLNLPAPEPEDDDLRQPKFPFTSKEIIVFSNSPLVDCHY